MNKASLIKSLLFLFFVIVIVLLLSGCGYSDHEPGSYDEEYQLLNEHIYQYMDRKADGAYSATGYLIIVDRNTSSVAGYVRNPFGGYTRAWAQTAVIGKNLELSNYLIQWRLESYQYRETTAYNSTWFGKYTFCNTEDDSDAFPGGVYLTQENAMWIFRNCQNETPVIVFESEYNPEHMT